MIVLLVTFLVLGGASWGGVGAISGLVSPVGVRSAVPEANAILKGEFRNTLVGATFEGVGEQIIVTTTPYGGFPVDGNSYVIMSSGDARYVLEEPPSGYDDAMGGITGVSPFTGGDAYDVATLTLKLRVPDNAKVLYFKWRLITGEDPDDVYYQDYFHSYVLFPDGKKVLAAKLPNGQPPYVGVLTPFVEGVTSEIYYVITKGVYTARIDVSPYAGQVITVVFQIGDVGDDVVDTSVMIDDLGFEVVNPVRRGDAYLRLLTIARLWTLRYFTFHDRFDELYENVTVLGVSNETLSTAMALHNASMNDLQKAWGNYDLKTVRRLMWSTRFMPKIGLVIKAYREEMKAIAILEKAIASISS